MYLFKTIILKKDNALKNLIYTTFSHVMSHFSGIKQKMKVGQLDFLTKILGNVTRTFITGIST